MAHVPVVGGEPPVPVEDVAPERAEGIQGLVNAPREAHVFAVDGEGGEGKEAERGDREGGGIREADGKGLQSDDRRGPRREV